MRQHLCIHYCLDNTIKPSGNSFFTAGYSTDLQRRKTLAFKIRMSWMQETDQQDAGRILMGEKKQYGDINTESICALLLILQGGLDCVLSQIY